MNYHFRKEALQRSLTCWQRVAPCLGCNISVMDSLGNHWHSASGYAQLESDNPLQPLSKCYIYSISKVFTAIRILQLVKQGRMVLDEKVAVYLGDLGLSSDITVRQLLNHTAGVPNYTGFSEYDPAVKERPGQPWGFAETLRRAGEQEADFPPGEGWEYSNTGYMLLARLIEVVTDQSYDHNITQHIIHPLGLQNTRVATDIDRGELIPGYSRKLNHEGILQDITSIYHPGWCHTGVLTSTTEDICQLFIALFNGKLIDAELLDEMCGFVSIGRRAGDFFPNPGYGLGLMIDPDWGTAGLYGHGGEGPGFNTWAVYIPDFNGHWLAITIFCNTSMPGQPVHLVSDLLRTLSA
ncbi:serine hydrolase domain-containing protein [Musicola paradisiaca]|uniref:Beta-lactamase n=1 Tax=Musicola paradisiaca (strain Ech703) TaxID=579405 RepID=C6CCI9_MUSP7|nr:serine hydrolase domain-containing protein [Musicola paradisiaca]ACS86832.1 beta-lactamase [Musicola paradisiaca Ech703]